MYIEGNTKLKNHLLNCNKNQWKFSDMKKFFVEGAEYFVEQDLYKFYIEFSIVSNEIVFSFKCDDNSICLEYSIKINNNKSSLNEVRNEFVNWLRKESITVDDHKGGNVLIIDLLFDEDYIYSI